MDEKNLIEWLLEAETPSIRYLVLRYLLGAAESSQEVQVVRKEMKATGIIPTILARQTEGGNWAGEHSYYTPKYTSTHWSMMLLTELYLSIRNRSPISRRPSRRSFRIR